MSFCEVLRTCWCCTSYLLIISFTYIVRLWCSFNCGKVEYAWSNIWTHLMSICSWRRWYWLVSMNLICFYLMILSKQLWTRYEMWSQWLGRSHLSNLTVNFFWFSSMVIHYTDIHWGRYKGWWQDWWRRVGKICGKESITPKEHDSSLFNVNSIL